MGTIVIMSKNVVFTPKINYTEQLNAGEIGFITAGIKHVSDCKVGDTITEENNPIEKLCLGLSQAFCCFLWFISSRCDDYEVLKDSLSKLGLNDASFTFDLRPLQHLEWV